MTEYNKDNPLNSMSFDFKLMFVYHIAMMILFGAQPFAGAGAQIQFAALLAGVLIIIAATYRIKCRWRWPGFSAKTIPCVILNLIFIYTFFAFSAYSLISNVPTPQITLQGLPDLAIEAWPIIIQAASIPTLTPWYLAGTGILAFNILSSLNLVTQSQSQFMAQCSTD